jgi:lipopolysaccharide transport system ATP-binding protein
MSSEPVITLSGVSKCFRMYDRPADRLKQFFIGRWKRVFREFWALHDVSFEVPRGACYGIVGRNGAGKSTLLQIIAGTLSPTSGDVQVRGKVAALLELGTGFNPDFTGRENIFLNAAILGLTQNEIRERYDDIVNFADIGAFIEQPVKTYSTGMMVRLAFAVAIHVDPDVLIIDEALAVGDAKFQSKCFRKFQDFRDSGKTILFVTHSTELIVRHCDQAVLLEQGRVLRIGDPKSVSNFYLDMLFGAGQAEEEHEKTGAPVGEGGAGANAGGSGKAAAIEMAPDVQPGLLEDRSGYNGGEYRWGNRQAEIVDCVLVDEEGKPTNHFTSLGTCRAKVSVRFHEDVPQPIYALTLKTPDGVVLYGHNSREVGERYHPRRKGDTVCVEFLFHPKLITGHYLISLGVVAQPLSGEEDVVVLDRRYDVIEIFVTNYDGGFGLIDLGMNISVAAV